MQSYSGFQPHHAPAYNAAPHNYVYPSYPSRPYTQPQVPPRRIGPLDDLASAAASGGGYGSSSGHGDVASSTAVNALALLSFMYFLKLIQNALSNKKMMMMMPTTTGTPTATVTGTGTPTGTSTGGTGGTGVTSANIGFMRSQDRSRRELPFDWEVVGEGRREKPIQVTLQGSGGDVNVEDVTMVVDNTTANITQDGPSWLEEFREMMQRAEDGHQKGDAEDQQPKQEEPREKDNGGMAETVKDLLNFLGSSATYTKKKDRPPLICFQKTACETVRRVRDTFGNSAAIIADILTNLALPIPEDDDDWAESILEAVTSGRNDCCDIYANCPDAN